MFTPVTHQMYCSGVSTNVSPWRASKLHRNGCSSSCSGTVDDPDAVELNSSDDTQVAMSIWSLLMVLENLSIDPMLQVQVDDVRDRTCHS